MLVQSLDSWTLQFKTKNAVMTVGAELEIGSVKIDGPGEFDVASISVQGLRGDGQTIYAIQVEDVNVCVFPLRPQVLTSDQVEQIGTVDVAVVPVLKDKPVSETMTLINSLEPKLVIVLGDGEIATLKGLVQSEESVLKLFKTMLPEDDRQIISLPLSK